MGVSWLDVVFSLLKFEGFTTENFKWKLIRIVTYPLVFLLFVGFLIWFAVGMLIVTFKSR